MPRLPIRVGRMKLRAWSRWKAAEAVFLLAENCVAA
jgi:hypothetical protein